MLTIRLSRLGKKKQPLYRVVIQEKSKDPWGDALEILGFYNPLTKPKTIEFKKERILYWLGKGAKTSPTVHNLLIDQGIISGPKRKATKIKKKEKKEEKEKKEKKEEKAKEEKTKESKKQLKDSKTETTE